MIIYFFKLRFKKTNDFFITIFNPIFFRTIAKQFETLAVTSFGSELLLFKSKAEKEQCQVLYKEPYFGWCQNSGERLMRSVFARNGALRKDIFQDQKSF